MQVLPRPDPDPTMQLNKPSALACSADNWTPLIDSAEMQLNKPASALVCSADGAMPRSGSTEIGCFVCSSADPRHVCSADGATQLCLPGSAMPVSAHSLPGSELNSFSLLNFLDKIFSRGRGEGTHPALQLNKPTSAPGSSDGATQFLTPPDLAMQLNKPASAAAGPVEVMPFVPPDPVMRNSTNPSSQATCSFSLLGSLPKIHIDLPFRISIGGGVPACSPGPTIYGPDEVGDNFQHNKKKDVFKRVLAKIEMIYSEVGLDHDSLESGYCCCLGLLNPKANIHINDFIFNSNDARLGKEGDMAQRSLEPLIKDSIFNSNASPLGKKGDMAQRSLDGLITFLTCLFPYLPDMEALMYLDAVDADPLAAAVLIMDRRGQSFKFIYSMDPTVSDATETIEMALKCAAAAAQHPNPLLLVRGWMNISHCLHEVAIRLSVSCPDYKAANLLHRNLRNEYSYLDVHAVCKLAYERFSAKLKVSDVGFHTGLPPVRAAMKRMLLAKIHGFYLKALCSLPKDELTERYHHALIMGGYCYGPLHPAANIIVNMIWYEQTFPCTKGFKTTMISTTFLWRVAARSLYGLISFLCARYPSLTPDHAMQRLLAAEVNLQVADPKLFDMLSNPKMDWYGCPKIGSGKDTNEIQMKAVRKAVVSVLEAYTAAATAAHHPSPHAQKEFLGSPVSVDNLKNASGVFRLDGDHQLSNIEFDVLCLHIRRCLSCVGMSHQQQEPETTEASRSGYAEASECVHRFWSLHDQVSSLVSAALEKFNRTHESQYSLHVICGVNELVSGPKLRSSHKDRGFSSSFPFKYQYSHINFLVTCLDKKLDGQSTKLFFAECNLDDGDDAWCVPVNRSLPVFGHARCFYCETEGNRIIHPALTEFHGSDFLEAFVGPRKKFYNNSKIIFLKRSFVDWVDDVEEDAIYEN